MSVIELIGVIFAIWCAVMVLFVLVNYWPDRRHRP